MLGDVRDVKALEAVFAADRPDVVLHAAALKHVPLMEQNPCETVLTNVMGAANIARLAHGNGVRRWSSSPPTRRSIRPM